MISHTITKSGEGREARGERRLTAGFRFHILPFVSCLLPRACRGAGGFTLLEVVMAMALLAIALPVLLGLRNRDVELLRYADSMTTATLLAQEKLFETELMGFPQTGEQTGDFQDLPPGSLASAKVKDRGRDYRWTRTVVSTPLDAVREVRIRVAWPRGKVDETVEITSYVFLDPKRPS